MMDMFFPPGASEHAYAIDRIVDWVHILMFVLFVGWGAFFTYVLFRFRKGKNPKANYHGTGGKASKYVEVGIAIAEVVSAHRLLDSALGGAGQRVPARV